MTTYLKWSALVGLAFAGLCACPVAADDAKKDPPKGGGEPLVVIDGMGKEHKLTEWKFVNGTRVLAWLAPANKPAEGPVAIEFRENGSTKYADGVLTLVPLDRARALTYDMAKETVKFDVVTGPAAEDKATLNGSIEYKDINRHTVEAKMDKPEPVLFFGGAQKSKEGINAIKFPAGKAAAHPAGRPAVMTTKTNPQNRPTRHAMSDIRPLYRFADGSEVLSPVLYLQDVKGEVKVDMTKVLRFKRTAATGDDVKWVATLGKNDDTLTLMTEPTIDKKPATLVGFVGTVPAGYKFFPGKLVEEIEFDVKD